MTIAETLHALDLELCGYLCDNAAQLSFKPVFPKQPKPLGLELWDEESWNPDPVRHLKDNLSPGLNSRLAGARAFQRSHAVLADEEIGQLVAAADAFQASLAYGWIPSAVAHWKAAVAFVGARGWKRHAADWDCACELFAGWLEEDGVSLTNGLRVLRTWVSLIRSILWELDRTDLFPPVPGTDSARYRPVPLPPDWVAADEEKLRNPDHRTREDMNYLRSVLRQPGLGAAAPTKAVIPASRIRRGSTLKALRCLELLGEYQGFQHRRRIPRSLLAGSGDER